MNIKTIIAALLVSSSFAVNALDLGHGARGIVRVGIGHRLHGNRMISANLHLSDAHHMALATKVLTQIHVSKFLFE